MRDFPSHLSRSCCEAQPQPRLVGVASPLDSTTSVIPPGLATSASDFQDFPRRWHTNTDSEKYIIRRKTRHRVFRTHKYALSEEAKLSIVSRWFALPICSSWGSPSRAEPELKISPIPTLPEPTQARARLQDKTTRLSPTSLYSPTTRIRYGIRTLPT